MKTVKLEKAAVAAAVAVMVLALMPKTTYGMHIMEGYLSAEWCVLWGALCAPFVVAGFFSIRKKIEASPKSLILLALCGAFAFVLSALKIPSVTGSSSHPTGVGLGAVMFGPLAMSVIGLIVLLFQALLLAHGGLTTLGANAFSMAVAGPLLAYGVYRLCRMAGVSTSIGVFLAAFVGDISTYIITSFQLALAFPEGSVMASFVKFLGIFALTQIPLAVCEGLLTVVVFGVVEKYSNKELRELSAI